jgi:hypothetical protein
MNGIDEDNLIVVKPAALEAALRVSTEGIDKESWVKPPLRSEGRTKLMTAAFLGILESVKVLIRYGASPYKRDGDGITALQHAVLKNEIQVARYLITEVHVPIEQPGLREGTALHWAAHHGFFEIVQLLVNHGANVNAKTVDNATPVALAIVGSGSTDLIRYLFSRGADPQEVERCRVGMLAYGQDIFKCTLCGIDLNEKQRPYPSTWTPPVVAPLPPPPPPPLPASASASASSAASAAPVVPDDSWLDDSTSNTKSQNQKGKGGKGGKGKKNKKKKNKSKKGKEKEGKSVSNGGNQGDGDNVVDDDDDDEDDDDDDNEVTNLSAVAGGGSNGARARDSALELERGIPEHLTCPITLEIMRDPVIAADGHTYERANIEEWLATHDTSPRTNLPLEHGLLISNVNIRKAIDEFNDSKKASK